MYRDRGKKRRGAATTTTPKSNQQKQFYRNSYSLASLKLQIGSILFHLQGRNQQRNEWNLFADCLSHYIDVKYRRVDR